jgi:hypothetical protein
VQMGSCLWKTCRRTLDAKVMTDQPISQGAVNSGPVSG